MPKKQIKKLTPELTAIEKLLSEQTLTILDAVDERLVKVDRRLDGIDQRLDGMDQRLIDMELRLNARMDKKILKMEERMNKKFDKLTATLDKFLKRTLDNEDEMEIMKMDIIRLKKVIREKIGVDLM